MLDLTVFGDPVLDYVYQLSDPTTRGGKMMGVHVGTFAGGTTSNVICSACRLGITGGIIGRVATGQESQIHINSFNAHNVDISGLGEVAIEQGMHTIIYIDPDGEKTLIFVPKDYGTIPDSTIAKALANTRFAYVMAGDFDWIDEACLHNATTPSPARICVDADAGAGLSPAQFEKIRHRADILFINDIGFAKLTGQTPTPETVAQCLSANGEILCCTGGGGTTYMAVRNPDGVKTYARPAIAVNVVDTTGAGDCFNASFMTELLNGHSAEYALDFAMVAGGLATQTMGARQSAPTRDAIMQRLNQNT